MTGGQRSRYLKTGGIAFFVFLVLYLITSRNNVGVRDVVNGMCTDSDQATTSALIDYSGNDSVGGQPCRCQQSSQDDEVLEVQLERQTFNSICLDD